MSEGLGTQRQVEKLTSVPKGHWSEGSLVRRVTGPKGHWSEGSLVRRVTGPKDTAGRAGGFMFSIIGKGPVSSFGGGEVVLRRTRPQMGP